MRNFNFIDFGGLCGQNTDVRANADLPLILGFCLGAPKTFMEWKIRAKVV